MAKKIDVEIEVRYAMLRTLLEDELGFRIRHIKRAYTGSECMRCGARSVPTTCEMIAAADAAGAEHVVCANRPACHKRVTAAAVTKLRKEHAEKLHVLQIVRLP